MMYDVIKILKKCLKFWYVFLITVALGCGILAYDILTAEKVSSIGNSLMINYLDKEKMLTLDNGNSIEYFNGQICGLVLDYYMEDNSEEIAKHFEISESDFDVKIEKEGVDSLLIFKVSISAKDKQTAQSLKSYINADLLNYVKEHSKNIVPAEYLSTDITSIEIGVSGVSESKDINLTNGILITLVLLAVEIVVVAFITIKNNTFLCNDEIEDEMRNEHNLPVLLKDYKHNLDSFKYRLNKIENLEKTTILIAEQDDTIKEIVEKINIQQISISDNDLCDKIKDNGQCKNVVLEIKKGVAKVTDINDIINKIQQIGITNILIVTCEKEKNESITCK